MKANRKIFILFGIMVGVIFISGCGKRIVYEPRPNQQSDTIGNTTANTVEEPPPPTVTETIKEETAEERLARLNADYFSKKKLFPLGFYSDKSRWANFLFASTPDCIGLENGDNLGGDLVSSIAEDDDIRQNASSRVNLNLYTKPYVRNLKTIVDNYISSAYQLDLFSYYLCHLSNGVDIVAGNLWSINESPYYIFEYRDGDRDVRKKDAYWLSPKTLLFVRDGRVVEFSNVQTITNTATGGETGPCDPQVRPEGIQWKCFIGLGHSESDSSTYGRYRNWLLSLEGEIIRTWESRN